MLRRPGLYLLEVLCAYKFFFSFFALALFRRVRLSLFLVSPSNILKIRADWEKNFGFLNLVILFYREVLLSEEQWQYRIEGQSISFWRGTEMSPSASWRFSEGCEIVDACSMPFAGFIFPFHLSLLAS